MRQKFANCGNCGVLDAVRPSVTCFTPELLVVHPIRSRRQHFLLSSPTQYPGKIVFELYVVHGPLLHLAGYWVPCALWRTLVWETQTEMDVVSIPGGWRYIFSHVVGWSVNLTLVLWAADVFNREVIERSARWIAWIEELAFVTRQ